MLVSSKETWLALLPWVSQNPSYFTTLNVMGDFFLLFDLTMDIFHGKFILEGLVTSTTPISRSKRVIYHGKSVQCNRTYMYCVFHLTTLNSKLWNRKIVWTV